MICLLTGISLLGGVPTGKRLAIVVKDHSGERHDVARDPDPMAVALVLVTRLVLAVEHGTRRVERAAQRSPEDAVDESGLIAHGCRIRMQPMQLGYELVA